MEENNVQTPRSFTYMSDTIAKIASALSKFQGSVEQPKLEKTVRIPTKSGSTYTYKYADLSACVRAAAPCLMANGLAVAQIISDGKLITILSHESGEWMKSTLMLPQQTTDYQAYGSAITYLKRYSYCAILGIVADTDDDATMAQGKGGKQADSTVKTSAADQMQAAIADMNKVTNEAEFSQIWAKWANSTPAVAQNGTEFYKVACAKRQQLSTPTTNA